MNKLSTERAIEALYTVRAYYASLTAGYPKGKDCKGIDDVTCSEIANSCLMAIKSLEQEPCEDAISRQAAIDALGEKPLAWVEGEYELGLQNQWENDVDAIKTLLPAQPKTGHWIDIMVGDMPAQACDRCNTFYPLAYTGGGHKYCPNCGAKMKESKEP